MLTVIDSISWDDIPVISFSELFSPKPVITDLLGYVTEGIGTVIKWISISLKALFDWGTVFDLPLMFALFIAISVILMSIKLLKWFF